MTDSHHDFLERDNWFADPVKRLRPVADACQFWGAELLAVKTLEASMVRSQRAHRSAERRATLHLTLGLASHVAAFVVPTLGMATAIEAVSVLVPLGAFFLYLYRKSPAEASRIDAEATHTEHVILALRGALALRNYELACRQLTRLGG